MKKRAAKRAKGFEVFEAKFPRVSAAYGTLGEAMHEAGPLTARERRLVKLAIAIGGRLEGAVRSHARRAAGDGIDRASLDHAAVLAVSTCGLPTAVAALTWIDAALRE